MSKEKWQAWCKSLPLLLIILVVLNPKIRAVALFVDFLGLDLTVLLLAIQMHFSRQVFMSHVVKPAYDALCFFSARPCFMPTLQTVREMPGMLVQALPLMPMFTVGILIVCAIRIACGLPI